MNTSTLKELIIQLGLTTDKAAIALRAGNILTSFSLEEINKIINKNNSWTGVEGPGSRIMSKILFQF